jgi:HK97 family phage prohead protease
MIKPDYIRSIDSTAVRLRMVENVELVKREVPGTDGEIKEVIRGYFAVYNKQYIMGNYYPIIETLAPGCFDGCDMSDVLCLYNHDDDMLLGRLFNNEGTLRIGFDDKGGFFEVDKANTTAWNDCFENIRLKNIRGCSFAFTIAEEKVDYDVMQPDGTTADMVTVIKVKKLYDVGPVNNPAYIDTSVEAAARSRKEEYVKSQQLRAEEQLLQIKLQSKIK